MLTDKPQILVVEDNYLMAKAVCHLVRDCGFDVAGAVGRIETGKRFLEHNKVDGAIVDINLDGMPSFEICDELARRNVPFFFLTGYERSAIPDAFRRTPLLTKPVELKEFRLALTTLAPHRPLAPERPARASAERGNKVLEQISAEAHIDTWSALLPQLEFVRLTPETVVMRQGEPIEHVYFPVNGLCSVYAHGHGLKIEIATIGKEGALGTTYFLGTSAAANESIVQLAMDAWRITASAVQELVRRDSMLQEILLRYNKELLGQIGTSAVAIGLASVEQRVARWLLTVVSRTGVDRIEVTHEALARAVGVRRAGITVALHHLESEGAIKSQRKLVRVVDQEKLAAQAGRFRPSET